MHSETSLNDSTVVKVCQRPKTGSKSRKKHTGDNKNLEPLKTYVIKPYRHMAVVRRR